MKRQVEIPVLSIEIRTAYAEIDVPDGLTQEEEQAFALAAYHQGRQGWEWESEYVIDMGEQYLGDSDIADSIKAKHSIIVHPAKENA